MTSTPVKVEYSLTPLDRTLAEPIAALCDRAALHGPEVVRAQDRYDHRTERDRDLSATPPGTPDDVRTR